MASCSSSIGSGEEASIRRYPASRARCAAETSWFGSSNSAIKPYTWGCIEAAMSDLVLDFRIGNERAHLEDRNHRQEAHEQEEQREEETNRANERGVVPERRS